MLSLYEVNQDLFITLLCENKARPSLKCNGHCQLAKIAKEEQKENAEQVLSSLQTDIFFYHQNINFSGLTNPNTDSTQEYTLAPNHIYHYLFYTDNDKPPTFLS